MPTCSMSLSPVSSTNTVLNMKLLFNMTYLTNYLLALIALTANFIAWAKETASEFPWLLMTTPLSPKNITPLLTLGLKRVNTLLSLDFNNTPISTFVVHELNTSCFMKLIKALAVASAVLGITLPTKPVGSSHNANS
uniref:Uncharacterized protein n=1 Tax=Onchocerca volvulus TaxID=6282 RepID=A0A8R1TPV9_ONCVO